LACPRRHLVDAGLPDHVLQVRTGPLQVLCTTTISRSSAVGASQRRTAKPVSSLEHYRTAAAWLDQASFLGSLIFVRKPTNNGPHIAEHYMTIASYSHISLNSFAGNLSGPRRRDSGLSAHRSSSTSTLNVAGYYGVC